MLKFHPADNGTVAGQEKEVVEKKLFRFKGTGHLPPCFILLAGGSYKQNYSCTLENHPIKKIKRSNVI